MKNSKHTKRALFASILSMLLCMAMLIGSTFAWFTDSVTSGKNKIVAGNLDVALEWADGTTDLSAEATSWADASTGAIFDYDKWEPGYTVARHIRVTNKGTLALKYQLKLAADGTVDKLAEVIDVYVFDNGKQLADRTELTDANKIGTLKAVLEGNPAALNENNLSAGASHMVTIALKMQETAGNEYQNQSIGNGFAVKLLATQYTEENDSFGNTYDASASFPVEVKTPDALLDALTAGGTVVLTQDITIDSATANSLVIGKNTILQLGNHKLDVTGVGTAGKEKIRVNNGATLTIDSTEGGSISYAAADTDPRLFSVENGSKLVINGGSFEIATTSTRAAAQGVYLDEGCTFEMNGGSITADKGTALNIAGKNCKVVINGGTLLSRNGNSAVNVSSGSTVEMNGGEVKVENAPTPFVYAFSGSRNAGEIVINEGHVAAPIAFKLGQNQKVTVNGGTIESARLNYDSKSGTLLTVNGGTIKGTGSDDSGTAAVVLDKGNVELRGGTYTPNYLYARNGANVKLFSAIYNGENSPAYGSDDNSTITFQ